LYIFYLFFKNQSDKSLISGYRNSFQIRQSHVHIKYMRSSNQNILVEDPQKTCSPFLWIRTFKFSAHHICSRSFLVSLQYILHVCLLRVHAYLY